MKVLVTGGTGFIGSALVRHLLTANYEVRILAHHKKNRFLIENLDVEIFDGDITNPEAVEKAMKDCSVVFDLASLYTFYPFWEKEAKALYKINVQGTINMLNAALKNKVQRFIHTSTIATIGKRLDGKSSDENTGFDFKNAIHYARSKYLAEQEVLKFYEKGLPVIILNPAIVIGERDYKPTPSGEAIVKFLNRTYPAYFDTLWAVADVDDVAKAHIAALKQGRIGERYILCNKSHYTLKEIFGILEGISGIKAPRIKIPYPFLLAFVYLEELLSYRIFKKKPLMPTEGVKFCHMSIAYDNAKAVSELGYAATPIKETLKKAVYWYRIHGYIEPRGILRLKAHGWRKINFVMKKLGMDKFTDKLNPGTLFFYFVVKALQFFEGLGFKPRGDGWRTVTESYLRTEHSKFALAVFRLDFWSNLKGVGEKNLNSAKKHLVERLAKFLKHDPSTHWQLYWRTFSTQRREKEFIDIMHAEFDHSGKLEKLEPYLDEKSGESNIHDLEPELRSALIREIIRFYNKTKGLPDKKRPLILKKKLKKWIFKQRYLVPPQGRVKAIHFVERILSAVFIHFEVVSSEEKRFHCPPFIKFKHPGFGFLNILCRFTSDLNEVDLWVQFSHIPADGVPMQELLNSIKRSWGVYAELKFPLSGYEKKNPAELCSNKNHKRGVYHIDEFVDFTPFLKLRRELNKKYSRQPGGTVTTAALLIWKLAHYPVFEDIKFAVPLDLRATAHRERTLGFVFIRPCVYFDRNRPDGGFFKFQQKFNRQLRATWRRRSESYKLLEYYALTPPVMYSATIKLLRKPLSEFVGTIGITIIKKAELFIAPFSDVHTAGFIAVSNYFIPGKDGERVCNISIKGPKDRITGYLDAVKEVARG